jgi:hypothetical protein
LEDYNDFKKDTSSSRIALNCAMTAWHLTDWIYHEFGFESSFKNIYDFQEVVKRDCESLVVMHDITSGSKHSS